MTIAPLRREPRRLPATVIAMVAAAIAVGVAGTAPAVAHGATPGQPTTTIELVGQTATVPSNGRFDANVRLPDIGDDGSVRTILHDRVRSRSELTASMDGDELRRNLYDVTRFVTDLPARPDGSRQVSLSFDATQPGGIRLPAEGAYPLEIVARDASGATVASLVTHVLAEPAPDDTSPPLSTAIVTGFGHDPVLQPDGSLRLDDADVASDVALAQLVADTADATVNLAPTPELVDALTDPDLADGPPTQLLELLRAAAATHPVLQRTYVDVSPQSLVDAGLVNDLTRHVARGREVLADVLGAEPAGSTAFAGPELADSGLAALALLGVEHLIVEPDSVSPLRPGILDLSLAQPFEIDSDTTPDLLDAFALDTEIVDALRADLPPVLAAHRFLAQVAVLWFEQPGVPRGVVVPIDSTVPVELTDVVLGGLSGSRIFAPVDIASLFETPSPLLDITDAPVQRSLEPAPAPEITPADARRLSDGWAQLDTVRALLGGDSPRTEPVADHLLLGAASRLEVDVQREHVAAAEDEVADIVGGVSTSGPTTVTLTAREGTVPLTLHNDLGAPVSVVVDLRSPKLEFPDGESIEVTLSEPSTRLDVEVRALSSGAFPLDIAVRSPDGRVVLDDTRYTVQSTAISGVGIVLSVGALGFLVVWWARHWRSSRRNAALASRDAGRPEHLQQ